MRCSERLGPVPVGNPTPRLAVAELAVVRTLWLRTSRKNSDRRCTKVFGRLKISLSLYYVSSLSMTVRRK